MVNRTSALPWLLQVREKPEHFIIFFTVTTVLNQRTDSRISTCPIQTPTPKWGSKSQWWKPGEALTQYNYNRKTTVECQPMFEWWDELHPEIQKNWGLEASMTKQSRPQCGLSVISSVLVYRVLVEWGDKLVPMGALLLLGRWSHDGVMFGKLLFLKSRWLLV